MLFLIIGVLIALIIAAVMKGSIVRAGIIGGVLGLAVFAVVAMQAPRPKVVCWTEAKGSEIWRAMPLLCSKKVEPARR